MAVVPFWSSTGITCRLFDCVTPVVVVVLLLFTSVTYGAQLCASCSNVIDQHSCNYHINCTQYESCYVRHLETDAGADLYDMGCMASTECPHSLSAIIGKRGEGHHVMCEACCNNATMCNQLLSCEAVHNQGPSYPRDCSELSLRERINDTYTIYPYGVKHKPVAVYCVFDFADVAWTVIQRRIDGSVDFYHDWRDYVAGFGTTNGEYWLGLESIHALTSIPNFELKVVMTDFEHDTKHAAYASFHVESASNNYRLTVYGYSGTAGDSMARQNGMMFSTYDKDNDITGSENCALDFHGGWWYSDCHKSNLNGKYLTGGHASFADGVEWYTWHGYNYSLKSTVMMIRKT